MAKKKTNQKKIDETQSNNIKQNKDKNQVQDALINNSRVKNNVQDDDILKNKKEIEKNRHEDKMREMAQDLRDFHQDNATQKNKTKIEDNEKKISQLNEELADKAIKDAKQTIDINCLNKRIEYLEAHQFTTGKALMLFIGSVIASGLVAAIITWLV